MSLVTLTSKFISTLSLFSVGEDSKIIFSGDYTQSDPVGEQRACNGVLISKILQSMPSFDCVEFGIEDIRSGLVKETVSKINMGM